MPGLRATILNKSFAEWPKTAETMTQPWAAFARMNVELLSAMVSLLGFDA
jgi:hypothetical protein